MKFDFPEQEAVKIVNITFKFTLWAEIQQIAHERGVSLSEAVNILLEPTIQVYNDQYHPEKLIEEIKDSKVLEKTGDLEVRPEPSPYPEGYCCENGNFGDGHECMKQSPFTDEQIIKGVRDLEAKAITMDFAKGKDKSVEIELQSISVVPDPLPELKAQEIKSKKKGKGFNSGGSYADVNERLNVEYQYCQNAQCISNGKFVKGTGFQVEDLIFCKRRCYDSWVRDNR